MPQGTMPIKLGSARNMPTKRFYQLMGTSAYDCNRVRNAVTREWQRWREDNPDWVPAQRRLRDGSLKFKKDGTPAMEFEMISQEVQNKLYHTYKKVCPHLSSAVASACWADALAKLRTNMPFDYNGPSRYLWQAILNHERQVFNFRAITIPCPNNASTLVASDDELSITFPLLSRASRCKTLAPSVNLRGYRSGGLSRGNQRLLQKIARGEIKRSDSEFVVNKKGEWTFNLSYHVPIVDHGLDQDRVAVIAPLRQNSRNPFEIRLDEPGHVPTWKIGEGVPYRAEVERVTARRKALRHRYRDGAGKGHGRKQFYTSLRPWSRRIIDHQDMFTKQVAVEIVRFCIRFDCGTVKYLEPTMPLRKLLWFDQNGIPFDWTKFRSYLMYKLETNGINRLFLHERKSIPHRIGVNEHKERYPNAWSQTT